MTKREVDELNSLVRKQTFKFLQSIGNSETEKLDLPARGDFTGGTIIATRKGSSFIITIEIKEREFREGNLSAEEAARYIVDKFN